MKNWLVSVCLGLLLFLVALAVSQWNPSKPDIVQVVFCDVGQGDATLIQYQSVQVLVDFSQSSQVLSCLEEHMPLLDRTLDFVVLTHPDLDHYGGFEAVQTKYSVATLTTIPFEKKTDAFEDFKSFTSSEVGVFFQSDSEYCLEVFKNGQLCVLLPFAADNSSYSQENSTPETILSASNRVWNVCESECNDLSIVVYFKYINMDVLLTGDVEEAGLLALADSALIVDVDVLKVPHHGAKNEFFQTYIEKNTPEIAVISSGANNRYGHPHQQILTALEQLSILTYRTDLQGTITFFTDGVQLWKQ